MVRYFRMKGRPALWIPGTDHAGIATQVCTSYHTFDRTLVLWVSPFNLLHLCFSWSWKRCWLLKVSKGQIWHERSSPKKFGSGKRSQSFFLQFATVVLCNLKLWTLKHSFLLITLTVYCISFALIRISSASLDF